MLLQTVWLRNLKLGMNVPYIIVQLRMQYKNSSFHNERDPCSGRPIYSLLKIRSRELFRSGLPWQTEAVGLENRTRWLDKGCVSENGGPSEKEPVREPPERPELPTVKAMEGWSLRVKFEKCSNGCEWPQKHDTWPLGCWVSEYQPSGPRKRPE